MASRKIASGHIILAPRSWIARATFILLLTLGVALMMMSRAQNPAVERFKTSLTDTLAPVLSAAASPFEAAGSITGWFQEMAALRQENIALKAQNRELLKWQAAAKDMEAENRSLRGLMNAVPAQTKSYITARIVSDMSGPYVRAALIAAGSENGIKTNQAVINDSGLIGRTVDVGAGSARVLLLSDINSRVPVVGEKTHEKSILTGNNDALPTLSYLAAGSKIEAGERIVTSGDGGVFPAGIPVGVVTLADKASGDVRVQLFADPAQVDYVSAVDYSF